MVSSKRRTTYLEDRVRVRVEVRDEVGVGVRGRDAVRVRDRVAVRVRVRVGFPAHGILEAVEGAAQVAW